eukprot:7384345-Prymnesium_polylepis.2
MCAKGWYRRHAHDPASKCAACDSLRGVTCGLNITAETMVLLDAYWRHSAAALQIWRCKLKGDWSPCRGGSDADEDGSGYCEAGYRGPRCELCNGSASYYSDLRFSHTYSYFRPLDDASQYFNKLDAKCHDCGDLIAYMLAVLFSLLFLMLAHLGCGVTAARFAARKPGRCKVLIKKARSLQRHWLMANMRTKVKALVGLYQCIAAVPSVFDVTTPEELEAYISWTDIIEFPSIFGVDLAMLPHPSCFGSYRTRLMIGSSWPIVLLLIAAGGLVGWEVAHDCLDTQLMRSKRNAVQTGLRRALPLILFVTFLLVPSASTGIFKTFACESFEYDNASNTTRRYLHADLALDCDSSQYRATKTVAFVFLALWPIGVPVLYTFLLWMSRDALRTGVPTSLSTATAFLSDGCKSSAFWWEPVEMCRKLTLSAPPLRLEPRPFALAAD